MKRGASEVSVELEVPFHDVDALRVAWHGHYFKYLELARTALLRRYGIDLLDMEHEGSGYRLVVGESSIRHLAPLRYGDRVKASAWFEDVEHRLNVSYELVNLTTGKPAARAKMILVVVGSDGELCLEIPEKYRARLPSEQD